MEYIVQLCLDRVKWLYGKCTKNKRSCHRKRVKNIELIQDWEIDGKYTCSNIFIKEMARILGL